MTPDDSRSWVLLGVIEAALGERKVAFAYLDRALDLAPLVIPRAVRMSGRSGPSGS